MQKPDPQPASAVVLPAVARGGGEVAVRVMAYVNNSPIFENELRDAAAQRMRELAGLVEPERTNRRRQIFQQEMDKIIERELILEEAFAKLKKMPPKVMEDVNRAASKEFDQRIRDIKQNSGIATDEQLKAAFEAQGVSMTGMRRQVERSFIAMDYVRNLIFPRIQAITLTDLHDYYKQHPDEFRTDDKIVWQYLFVDAGRFPSRESAKAYADQVMRRSRLGFDFPALLKEAANTGNLQEGVGSGEKPGEIRPAQLEPVLLAMKPGDVSEPMEFGAGFHIVKVTHRTQAGRKPFDGEVQAEIRRRIQNLIADREYKRMVARLRAEAVVQIVAEP
jgi:hypothetical protein